MSSSERVDSNQSTVSRRAVWREINWRPEDRSYLAIRIRSENSGRIVHRGCLADAKQLSVVSSK